MQFFSHFKAYPSFPCIFIIMNMSAFIGAREECRQWSWSLEKKAMFFMIPDWI
mgnify:CR=1 FL=1|jgi:hypothetical protein